jgi:hypothetical protein
MSPRELARDNVENAKSEAEERAQQPEAQAREQQTHAETDSLFSDCAAVKATEETLETESEGAENVRGLRELKQEGARHGC